MGKFIKGQSGNPKGRPKGKPNKTTDQLRGVFQSFIESNIHTMQDSFDQLEPKDQLYFIERLARLVLPPIALTDKESNMDQERARVAALFPTAEEWEQASKELEINERNLKELP